uniref:Uncharacterized protein n=1 Tax=Myotis myotis TaxID=51298 RepID=A0A7J7VIQ7_MYOMY|nr:hypothetical protein mMyoMyo1_008341 [Myotis myotis]
MKLKCFTNPSPTHMWCSEMSRGAKATGRKGEGCPPLWRPPVSSNCLPKVSQVPLPLQTAAVVSPGSPWPPRRGTRRDSAQHSHSLTTAHAHTHAAPTSSQPFLLFFPFLQALSQSLSQNEAPGWAEGGAVPLAPPLPCQERGRGRKGGREAWRTAEKNRETDWERLGWRDGNKIIILKYFL